MADAYATAEMVEDFAQQFEALGDLGQETIIFAASRLFDNLCEVDEGFFAEAGATATEKEFTGTGTAYLMLPPYVGAVTTVEILDDDDNTVDNPEYRERNGALVIKGHGQGLPTPDENSQTSFTGWPLDQQITVTARWGFAAIPDDVAMAVIQMALAMWRHGDAAFTTLSDAGAPIFQQMPIEAMKTVEKYKQKYSQKALFA